MTLMSCAHDIDLYAAWARLAVHDEFDPPPARGTRSAPPTSGPRAPGASIVAVARARPGQRGDPRRGRRGPAARAGPADRRGTYEGDGYVIVRDPDTGGRRARPWPSSSRTDPGGVR